MEVWKWQCWGLEVLEGGWSLELGGLEVTALEFWSFGLLESRCIDKVSVWSFLELEVWILTHAIDSIVNYGRPFTLEGVLRW